MGGGWRGHSQHLYIQYSKISSIKSCPMTKTSSSSHVNPPSESPVQQLSKKVAGLTPGSGGLSMWSLRVLTVSVWVHFFYFFTPGTSAFSHSPETFDLALSRNKRHANATK